MSTFESLVSDLTRDAQRAQPKDALQFCANWFQQRLEEQRAQARDLLAQRSDSISTPSELHTDSPLIAPKAPSLQPRPSMSFKRPSYRESIAASPFGTLNVPGNALLTGDRTPPSMRYHQSELPPTSPLTTVNPFASFDNSTTPTTAYHDNGFNNNGGFDNDGYLMAPTSSIFARRTSVSAESITVDSGVDEVLPVFPKTPEQLRRIKVAIRNNFIFRDLDEEQTKGVLDAMQERKAIMNEVVIRQGDVGEYFYVVEEGQMNCYIRPEPLPPNWLSQPNVLTNTEDKFTQPKYHPELGRLVLECKAGGSFGELALMYGHPRAASVLAVEPSTLWALDRITFRTIILKAAHRRRTMYEQFLGTVPLLSSLDAAERSKVADALSSQSYKDGEAVVKQGDIGDTFFFIEEGEAVATKRQTLDNGQIEDLQVGHLKKGDYFGELSLLRAAPRAATVSAVLRADPSQPKLKVAALDASAFTRLLGPLRELMEKKAGENYGRLTLSSR
ncbi:camp-dependent protein kinase regulatory subunit [Coprinellus micaceus]|uniref:cAMP-dependent protein kinase regulatory subunit n=1 Tax=Coprinellus micaceus TaxID=71717 RepID=A0A4Y7TNV7_COPMI|nr:camp-dependent protein kinase regulatory subunit [Coprinellus micaceus]